MDDKSPTPIVSELVAAFQLARPLTVANIPTAIVPPGYSLQKLEHMLIEPARRRGNFAADTAESFTRLVNILNAQWQVVDRTAMPIFFRRDSGAVTVQATIQAVINFNTWRDLLVTLTQELSEPFAKWWKLDGCAQTQRQFSLFLEERTAHVVKPEGAALLELCRKFKANQTVRYSSVIEEQNGDNSLEFIRTTEAGTTSARGRMKVPDRITLCLPVWHGGEPVEFEARFRYEISGDGTLSLSFEILRFEELLDRELRKLVDVIGKAIADSVVIEGGNAPVEPLK